MKPIHGLRQHTFGRNYALSLRLLKGWKRAKRINLLAASRERTRQKKCSSRWISWTSQNVHCLTIHSLAEFRKPSQILGIFTSSFNPIRYCGFKQHFYSSSSRVSTGCKVSLSVSTYILLHFFFSSIELHLAALCTRREEKTNIFAFILQLCSEWV